MPYKNKKKKEVIGDRTRTTKTKKSGKTVVKDKYKSTKKGDIKKSRTVAKTDGSKKTKRKFKGLGTQKY